MGVRVGVGVERVEDDHLVEPVEELGPVAHLERVHHLEPHLVRLGRVALRLARVGVGARAEVRARVKVRARARVRRVRARVQGRPPPR